MGYFVDNEDIQPKDIVNSYVSSYLNGTEQYSTFQDSAPNFVTYYSKNQQFSSSDHGLDNVEEIIGTNSPLRYNKLKDFPIYGVSEATPQTNWDEDFGVNLDQDSEAFILPNTIQPLPDDFLIFQYQSKEDSTSRIYRVTNVEVNNLENQSYYKIQYENFNVNSQDIERQVEKTYRTVFSNIGTENKSLILEDDFYQVNTNIKYSDELSKIFLDNFYNPSLNTFIFYEEEFNPVAEVKFIDLNLSRFVADENLLIKSNTYLSNIVPYKDKNPRNQRLNERNYRDSIYNKLINKEDLPNVITINDTKDSFLKIFREKYKEINYIYNAIEDTSNLKSLNNIVELPNISKINRINKDYQNKNSLYDLDVRYKMIILYLQDEKFEENLIKKVYEHYNNKRDMSLEDYILLPCLIYIVKNNIEKVFKK